MPPFPVAAIAYFAEFYQTKVMRCFALFLLVFALFTACSTKPADTNASAAAKRYKLQGKVVSVDRAAKKAKIEHDRIEGYMDAMTMDFPIHADWLWDDLLPGAEIRAELVVDNAAAEPYWLENVGIIAAADPSKPAPAINENFAQIGKDVPNFTLTDQDGKPVSISSFKGKALAITFIYAKCPLPDFCIRMSTNFSDLANQAATQPEIKDKIRLLSISFDPANDTPAKLKAYGLGYMGKGSTSLGIWSLAVGKDADVRKIADFFGLRYEIDPNDKTQFNHSLRTAVISPEGKVTKIFAGNEWTTQQLLRELEQTLAPAK